jgi:hypothetical protein
VKVLVNRKSLLREILKIEGEIKMKRRDPKYVWIKHNIFSLEGRRFGSHTVSIASPDDPEIILEMRNNSQEMRDVLSRYKEMRTEFDVQVDEMVVRKTKIQRQLFERPS